jgi:hypothetical protein
LKEAENLDVVPENLEDDGLKAAYQDANKYAWTKEELDAYDYAAMREQDERGKFQLLEKRTKAAIARNMKAAGLDHDLISRLSGLSADEIEAL